MRKSLVFITPPFIGYSLIPTEGDSFKMFEYVEWTHFSGSTELQNNYVFKKLRKHMTTSLRTFQD